MQDAPALSIDPLTRLAPWGSDPAASRGRRHPVVATRDRNDFQRDRDRIVHSTAFRRLVYKTQVFLNHEGDLFRTRLTHSLEVAQLGRAIARTLGLNEDLVEAIALAHDLGHTPFGHAGQDALHACMAEHGGFEHNLQSLRVVDVLEARYAAFDGLNLTFETREGILKHCSRRDAEVLEADEPGGVARRFIDGTRPGLEAQLTDLADAIAYNAHDIDDGVRSGLITLDQVCELPLVRRHRDAALAEHPALAADAGRRLLYETIRRMLSAQVHDVIDASAARLREAAPGSADAARTLPRLIGFSDAMREEGTALKRLLFQALYRHPQVNRTTELARQVVRELFAAYVAAPQEMRPGFAARDDRHRAVADFIAGMTDRFALGEHRRLTGRDLFAELAASTAAADTAGADGGR
ncbi:deoxyguanosinetriphosphate triphosphohydrolase [Ideonella sp. DXS22W]|uniref:Deoxyguanosinetriphosphate triphosphohydrolase-like protein n=1 Tax=Pseudaquabacterium inlustre TaxID=2984192 RepID=A0ABU9CNM9_9BURK